MASASLVRRFPQAAVLVRLAAFLTAIASVVVVLWACAAAVHHHVTGAAALATAGIAVALTLVAALAARSLDPLRT